MGIFTKLEAAALEAVYLRFPGDKAALTAQLASAEFVSRDNTGAGFYTRFKVSSGTPLSGDRTRPAGWTGIDGLENPMGFVLWLTDGYANCIEGFTVEDGTEEIDFTTVGFTLPFDQD